MQQVAYLLLSNIAANAVQDMMLNSDTGATNLRFVQRPSRVTLAIEANAVGIELQVRAGTRTVVPRSSLDAGGTTGVFPNLDQKAFQFMAAAGEILEVEIRETAGVATTDVMATIGIQPLA